MSSNKVKQDSYTVGFLSGATAACCSETITIPLDTAKVRMMLYGCYVIFTTLTNSSIILQPSYKIEYNPKH